MHHDMTVQILQQLIHAQSPEAYHLFYQKLFLVKKNPAGISSWSIKMKYEGGRFHKLLQSVIKPQPHLALL